MSSADYAATRATGTQRLQALADASDTLTANFGSWRRHGGRSIAFSAYWRHRSAVQRCGPSIPVPFTSARWGSLASFGAQAYPGTKKWYGTSGNSFVAVVEFGDSVRARAVTRAV